MTIKHRNSRAIGALLASSLLGLAAAGWLTSSAPAATVKQTPMPDPDRAATAPPTTAVAPGNPAIPSEPDAATPTSQPGALGATAPASGAAVSQVPTITEPALSPLADDADLLLPGTTAKQYTLQQAVDAALAVPLTALRLQLIHDESFRELQLARANLDPKVTINAKARLTDAPSTSDNSSNDPFVSSDRYRVGVGVSYPLINHGITRDQVDIAQQNLVVADTDVIIRRRDVVRATVNTFYDLVARQRDVHNRDLAVQALQQQLLSSQARYNLGAVTKGDVLSSTSALASAQADQGAARLNLQESRARFAALVGQDPEVVSPVSEMPQQAPVLSQSAATVLHQTLTNDPQVAALEAQKTIANKNLAVTKARHQVSVTLVTGAGLHQHDNGVGGYYDVGINFSLPILDTPAYKASVSRDKDNIELRNLDEEQYGLTAKADDLAAILAYQSAIARVEPATESVSAAEEAFRLRQGQYAIGSATQEQVLSNLSSLVSRRNDLANVLADRDLAVRRLLLNEGTINIQSLDKFPQDNPAAAPTDTGASAAATNGGAVPASTTNTPVAIPAAPGGPALPSAAQPATSETTPATSPSPNVPTLTPSEKPVSPVTNVGVNAGSATPAPGASAVPGTVSGATPGR